MSKEISWVVFVSALSRVRMLCVVVWSLFLGLCFRAWARFSSPYFNEATTISRFGYCRIPVLTCGLLGDMFSFT